MENKSGEFAITRMARHFRPAHYLLKIQSYSLLCETGVEKYDSGVFEVGGHKWRLSLYPKGNEKMNGAGHISIYLSIVDTEKSPLGWEVNASFKLFVYDQIRDKFLTIQDVEGAIRRFHDIKTEWGFDKFLPLDSFNVISNGYLVNDCCVFGVEIFVHERSAKRECLTMIKEPPNRIMTWKIENFSQKDRVLYASQVYVVGELKWKILIYPNGFYNEAPKAISVFLDSVDCVAPDYKFFVDFKLRIRDQINNEHAEERARHWFSASCNDWGFSQLLSRKDLEDASKGFLVEDTLIVEAEIMVMSTIK
ncbi:MATH domain and coiled-coil domain-containing protein At3g58200-like [Quercus lobata]|nr:MATH domain and coiled-coil domain-containing protein At3g58200-like [Quercus lobata]